MIAKTGNVANVYRRAIEWVDGLTTPRDIVFNKSAVRQPVRDGRIQVLLVHAWRPRAALLLLLLPRTGSSKPKHHVGVLTTHTRGSTIPWRWRREVPLGRAGHAIAARETRWHTAHATAAKLWQARRVSTERRVAGRKARSSRTHLLLRVGTAEAGWLTHWASKTWWRGDVGSVLRCGWHARLATTTHERHIGVLLGWDTHVRHLARDLTSGVTALEAECWVFVSWKAHG